MSKETSEAAEAVLANLRTILCVPPGVNILEHAAMLVETQNDIVTKDGVVTFTGTKEFQHRAFMIYQAESAQARMVGKQEVVNSIIKGIEKLTNL